MRGLLDGCVCFHTHAPIPSNPFLTHPNDPCAYPNPTCPHTLSAPPLTNTQPHPHHHQHKIKQELSKALASFADVQRAAAERESEMRKAGREDAERAAKAEARAGELEAEVRGSVSQSISQSVGWFVGG